MQQDYSYLVYCYVDRSNRIVASSKLDKFIGKTTPSYQRGDEVTILVAEPTELGYKAVVDGQHWANCIKIRRLNRCVAVITAKLISIKSATTAKLICCWKNPAIKKPCQLLSKFCKNCKAIKVSLPLSDKSEPEAIYAAFGISKKVFKQAIGGLLKDGKIVIEPSRILLK